MSNKIINIYTDGACRGNPGPGGWGALLEYNGHTKKIYGSSALTTNNIMELTAVIESLKIINKQSQIIITTDSTYVKNGITKWIHNWKLKGWKTASKKPVKNKSLWKKLDSLSKQHTIQWEWVRGHTGHPGNEEADILANKGIDELA
jgi:ribonuclease HI